MRVWGQVAVAVLLAGCSGQAAPAPSVSSPASSVSTPATSPSATSSQASSVSTPAATPTLTPTPTPSPKPDDAVTRIEVSLIGDKAEPNGDKVELTRGDTVEFVVTADHDDELHLHGMDIEIPVKAGKTVTRRVVVEQTGRFEVESHHPALVIVQLIVR